MVHLSIPAKLKPSPSSGIPVPNENATPRPEQQPTPSTNLILKVKIIKARNLCVKDRSGTSDPFLVLSYNSQKFSTDTVPKTLNPIWDTVFDVIITHGSESEILEAVCWGRDRFRKEYLGEFDLSIAELFADGALCLDDPTNVAKWYPLHSTHKRTKVSGDVQVKVGLVDPANPNATKEELQAAWDKFIGSLEQETIEEIRAIMDHPATESVGIGMIRVNTDDSEYPTEHLDEEMRVSKIEGATEKEKGRGCKRRYRRRFSQSFELPQNAQDVMGIVFMEVQGAKDLPPERNATYTGFDMDPFVIVSFGKRTFRTRVIRHSLNPDFDERLIFQVMNSEKHYTISFNVYDRDMLTSNDFVAQAFLPISDLIDKGPTPDPETGLYKMAELWKHAESSRPKAHRHDSKFHRIISHSSSSTSPNGKKNNEKSGKLAPEAVPADNTYSHAIPSSHSSTSSDTSDAKTLTSAPPFAPTSTSVSDEKDPEKYILPLKLRNEKKWGNKHSSKLFLRAKFVPYAALRQQLWRSLLNQYDANENGLISRVELVAMLEPLQSTLSEHTIDGFFQRFRQPMSDQEHLTEDEELTIDQAVICLEDQLLRQKKGSANDVRPAGSKTGPAKTSHLTLSSVEPESSRDLNGSADFDDNARERVIRVITCPLCQQPRLNKRSEVDIITHLATCASRDWARVDRFVMGGFVTSDQAHRKWYSKAISKVTYGGYKLGANSANILVQDRLTGQIHEERMSVYVRLGIRLLYKGLRNTATESQKIKQLLRSLSIKQGQKYDSPHSAREIRGFVRFHQLDLAEVLSPVEKFTTFNEFFCRQLKPGARICTAPDNSSIAVSPADCRSVVFNKIEKATEIWIKGRGFTVKRLLSPVYSDEAAEFEGGALGIFRMAPQDYHRFHVPVDGVLGEPRLVEGQYYTVNPMAIRSTLDVYGENVRVIVPIDTEQFGRIMVICVGAMMVGSVVITAKKGQKVRRTEELGHFKFGGSTVLLLFQPGTFVWDDDLVANAKQSLETLLRVGQSVGHHPSVAQIISENEKKENITDEDLRDAARRIGGSLDDDTKDDMF